MVLHETVTLIKETIVLPQENKKYQFSTARGVSVTKAPTASLDAFFGKTKKFLLESC